MEKKPYPSEMQERFIIRLPDGMRDRIAEEAKASGRSMNAEIVTRLEASFDAKPSGDSALMAQLRDLIGRSQVEIWDAKMKAGMLGRLVLTLLITDEIEQATGTVVPQQARSRVIKMLEDQSQEAILSAHKTAATWFGATKEVLAKNEIPEDSPLKMISEFMGSLEVTWGDAEKDYFLNEYFEKKPTTGAPVNTETNHSSAAKKDPKSTRTGANSKGPSLQSRELGAGLADARPTKPVRSFGLADTSEATGVGSKPLPQRTGLANAEPVRSPRGPGLASSKRAKSPK